MKQDVYAPVAIKSKKVIFSTKVKIKVIRSFPLVPFEKESSVDLMYAEFKLMNVKHAFLNLYV